MADQLNMSKAPGDCDLTLMADQLNMSKAPGACEPQPLAMRSARALAVSLLVFSVAVVVVAAAAACVSVGGGGAWTGLELKMQYLPLVLLRVDGQWVAVGMREGKGWKDDLKEMTYTPPILILMDNYTASLLHLALLHTATHSGPGLNTLSNTKRFRKSCEHRARCLSPASTW